MYDMFPNTYIYMYIYIYTHIHIYIYISTHPSAHSFCSLHSLGKFPGMIAIRSAKRWTVAARKPGQSPGS